MSADCGGDTSALLDALHESAASHLRTIQPPPTIRQIANIELCVQPTSTERLFNYNIHMVYVLGQGCCYTTSSVAIDRNLIGKSALLNYEVNLATRIAILDALYAGLPSEPAASMQLTGDLARRSAQRASFIADNICNQFSLRTGMRVAQIGVVGAFLQEFNRRGIVVDAFDLDPALIGRQIHGTEVKDGRAVTTFLRHAHVALITGMSLWTNTFCEIARSAHKSGTNLVIFAETGAHLAPYLLRYGAAAAISEPFPFYVFGGSSAISYYTSIPETSERYSARA